CQFAECALANAQRTPSAVTPRLTQGFSVTYSGSSKRTKSWRQTGAYTTSVAATSAAASQRSGRLWGARSIDAGVAREERRRDEPELRQPEGRRGREAADTVAEAPPEADRRRVGGVRRRTRDLADHVAEPHDLREHLAVEDEVVGVRVERKPLEHLAREGAVPRVVLRELRAEEKVLHERQHPVPHVPPPRHPALERASPEDPRAEDGRIETARDQPRHRRDELRRVLVVGVHHDDDVGAFLEREPVAGLLVRTVAAVLRMRVDPRLRQRSRERDRLVVARVVDHDHPVDDAGSHRVVVGPAERPCRVVRGHDDDHLLAVDHGALGAGADDRAASYMPTCIAISRAMSSLPAAFARSTPFRAVATATSTCPAAACAAASASRRPGSRYPVSWHARSASAIASAGRRTDRSSLVARSH